MCPGHPCKPFLNGSCTLHISGTPSMLPRFTTEVMSVSTVPGPLNHLCGNKELWVGLWGAKLEKLRLLFWNHLAPKCFKLSFSEHKRWSSKCLPGHSNIVLIKIHGKSYYFLYQTTSCPHPLYYLLNMFSCPVKRGQAENLKSASVLIRSFSWNRFHYISYCEHSWEAELPLGSYHWSVLIQTAYFTRYFHPSTRPWEQSLRVLPTS